jgi:hypothetical protein
LFTARVEILLKCVTKSKPVRIVLVTNVARYFPESKSNTLPVGVTWELLLIIADVDVSVDGSVNDHYLFVPAENGLNCNIGIKLPNYFSIINHRVDVIGAGYDKH